MAKLVWDQIGEHYYETGVNHGVLFPFDKTQAKYGKGVAWNGLTGVTESPSGAEATALYADNIKYLNLYSAEEFGATVTAYTYPDEFAVLDGSAEIAKGVAIGQQNRGTFGLAYRTEKGNDTSGSDYGYKIHIIYGATASPSEKGYSTINDSPEAIEFSWELNTTPVSVAGFKPTATLVIDSTKSDASKLAAFENILYGTTGSVSYSEATGITYATYTEVESPTGNPATNGYYEKNGDVYALSTDTTVDASKTYYTKTAGSNPNALGLYERSGEVGAYVYTLSLDTEANESKTYFTKTETGGSEPRLPLPDEVASLFAVNG